MESRLKTIKAITQLVFAEDKIKKVDLIIVPGSSQPLLPQKAADLYLQGFAKKILFTGGVNPKTNRAEGDFGREIAVNKGVPKNNTYCENNSINTKENATESLVIIKRLKIKCKTIILVSKPYHARRLLMTFAAVFPDSDFIIVPVEDERGINKDNWWDEKERVKKVMEEIGKISQYYLKGDLSLKS